MKGMNFDVRFPVRGLLLLTERGHELVSELTLELSDALWNVQNAIFLWELGLKFRNLSRLMDEVIINVWTW